MTAKQYAGQEVVISFEAQRCIHSAECVRGAPEVFDAQAKPWIRPDAASGDKIAQVVRRCPTGALSLRFHDGRAAEAPDALNTVTLQANGPLLLRGQISLQLADGSQQAETRVALCRCGASAHKPWCDGAHRTVQFADPGLCLAQAEPAADAPAAQGPLRIQPQPNGPLMLQGLVQLRAADGRRLACADPGWLCRCGHSQNKPFCDGSHRAAGFQG